MKLHTTDALFAWDRLPDSPGLSILKQLLDLLPDAPLLQALRRHRGRGRDDYPMHVLWRAHVARYVLRHATMEACLGELERNPALRKVVGIQLNQAVPRPWNMTRFLEVLGLPEHQQLMGRMFEQLTGRLLSCVDDLGAHLAGDSAALCGRAGKDDPASGLARPDAGVKQYLDEQGKVVRSYQWFGYKFHLLVDVKHEVILAYELSSATTADCTMIPALLRKLAVVAPPGRVRTLAYDKAADSAQVHGLLSQAKIKPLIEIRNQWKQQTEMLLPGHDGNSNVVHDEAGTLYCYDKQSAIPTRHKMAYIGYEKGRGTLKYRCPCRHEGWTCPSDRRCNGESSYGKTVRVKCELDLRRFPPIPRGTAEFERRYKGRTAVERANARVKVFWGSDDGNVTGAARFHAHLHTIMLVHGGIANLLAMAPRHEGRSLSPTRLSVIARRLRQAASG
jgi:hypothetical protein